MEPTQAQRLKLLITIVDRDKGQHTVDLLLREGLFYHRIVLGRGTAKSEILELLGIGDTAKDIVISVMSAEVAPRALHRLKHTLQFDNPGHGIAFTVPIGSVGGQRALQMLSTVAPNAPERTGKEYPMDTTTRQYDLILAIVNHGFADDVMDAARPAGARGGTVLHARGAGTKEAEHFFGITIQPEKDMVMILTERETKRAIMEAICKGVGLSTEGQGVVFSLPVDEATGVVHMMRDED